MSRAARGNQSRSETLTGSIGARRACTVSMISPLSMPCRVDGRDAEVAVAQLALNDDQRHSFPGHLDRVSVRELVRREAAPDPGGGGSAPQLGAGRGGRPMAATRRSDDDAQQRTDRELAAQLEP